MASSSSIGTTGSATAPTSPQDESSKSVKQFDVDFGKLCVAIEAQLKGPANAFDLERILPKVGQIRKDIRNLRDLAQVCRDKGKLKGQVETALERWKSLDCYTKGLQKSTIFTTLFKAARDSFVGVLQTMVYDKMESGDKKYLRTFFPTPEYKPDVDGPEAKK